MERLVQKPWRRKTLAGTLASLAAIAFFRHSQIRDLSIGNQRCCGQVGIDLSNSTLVDVENVRVSDFAFGIAGHASYFNTIEGSNLSTNGVGIRQGDDTTTWQMHENAISFSRLAGIGFHATTRASVVSGGVLESNPFGAIFLRGTGNIVQSTWFETNGTSNGGFAVRVSAAATNSRILTSLFSNNDILDPSPSTLRCYNTAVGPLIADNCP
jgi:Periplasmic copper-binding protein (NosD)